MGVITMRILQVNKLYAPVVGGVETVVRDIAEGLTPYTNMQVLVCQPKGRRTYELFNGVEITRANSLGTLLSMPLSLDFFRQYKRVSQNADIVQLHFPFPLADLAVWLFGCKGKLVVWWHSDIVRQKIFLKFLVPLIHRTLKRADSIIVASNETLSSSKFLPAYAHKCTIIPFGLDFNAYKNINNKNFLITNAPHSKKLLFVGRLVYYKGVDILIKAMKSVENAELFVVGNGALEEQLKSEAESNQTNTKIHFLGTLPREQLLSAYNSCDCLIFPSCANSEAFGLTQLEAMYYAKPVINTNLPTAVPWVSVHEETGLTVPVGDVTALANAINRLVNDDTLREKLGQNARQRVQELFDRRDMMKKLYSHYQNLLEC